MPEKLKTILPKKLKIGAHVYDVNLVDRATNDVVDGAAGIVCNSGLYIKISRKDFNGYDKAGSVIWCDLFHELLHAWDVQSGLNIFDGQENEETKIDVLASLMFQTLNDNGLLKSS